MSYAPYLVQKHCHPEGLCPNFSSAVITTFWFRATWGEEECVWAHSSRLQSIVVGKSQLSELEAVNHITFALSSWERWVYSYSASFLFSYPVQVPKPENGTTHNGLNLHTSVKAVRQPPVYMPTRQPYLESSSVRLSSQINLSYSKSTVKIFHHWRSKFWARFTVSEAQEGVSQGTAVMLLEFAHVSSALGIQLLQLVQEPRHFLTQQVIWGDFNTGAKWQKCVSSVFWPQGENRLVLANSENCFCEHLWFLPTLWREALCPSLWRWVFQCPCFPGVRTWQDGRITLLKVMCISLGNFFWIKYEKSFWRFCL